MKNNQVSTRDRLIAAAQRRFYREGFRGVGIDQVYAEVGISKTAFYKHFESKEGLMLAVIEEHDRWMNASFRAMLAECQDASVGSQVQSLFDMVETFIESEGYQGCFFVNVTMEFPLQHDPIHMAAARAKQSFETIVDGIAERGGAINPRHFASALCLVMEGAYVTRHVSGDRQALTVARELGRMLVAQHFPQTASTAATS